MNIKNAIGERLRKVGVSQAQAASELGVTPQFLSGVLNGNETSARVTRGVASIIEREEQNLKKDEEPAELRRARFAVKDAEAQRERAQYQVDRIRERYGRVVLGASRVVLDDQGQELLLTDPDYIEARKVLREKAEAHREAKESLAKALREYREGLAAEAHEKLKAILTDAVPLITQLQALHQQYNEVRREMMAKGVVGKGYYGLNLPGFPMPSNGSTAFIPRRWFDRAAGFGFDIEMPVESRRVPITVLKEKKPKAIVPATAQADKTFDIVVNGESRKVRSNLGALYEIRE